MKSKVTPLAKRAVPKARAKPAALASPYIVTDTFCEPGDLMGRSTLHVVQTGRFMSKDMGILRAKICVNVYCDDANVNETGISSFLFIPATCEWKEVLSHGMIFMACFRYAADLVLREPGEVLKTLMDAGVRMNSETSREEGKASPPDTMVTGLMHLRLSSDINSGYAQDFAQADLTKGWESLVRLFG